MQNTSPIKKPLILVLIGLIIGASFGFGSGYALFFPEIVKQQTKTTSEQIQEIEEKTKILSTQIKNINWNLTDVSVQLETVDNILDDIIELQNHLDNIESTLHGLEDEKNNIQTQLNSLESNLNMVEEQWNKFQDDFSSIQNNFNNINNEITNINEKLGYLKAEDLIKKELANPNNEVIIEMTEKIYDSLYQNNQPFQTWVNSIGEIGESTAKSLMKPMIYSLVSTWNWFSIEKKYLSSSLLQLKIETYFPFDFIPASIMIPKINLKILGKVNITSEEIIEIKVISVNII